MWSFEFFLLDISTCFIRWDQFWGINGFEGGLMMYVFFHKAKLSAGRRGLFCKFRFIWGCIVFNILNTLEFFLTYILRVVTVLSSLNLSAIRHLHILRLCVHTYIHTYK